MAPGRLAFGVRGSGFGVWRLAFSGAACGVRRSMGEGNLRDRHLGDAHGHPLQSDEERESLRLTYGTSVEILSLEKLSGLRGIFRQRAWPTPMSAFLHVPFKAMRRECCLNAERRTIPRTFELSTSLPTRRFGSQHVANAVFAAD
jgi:hypothetical protein